jgi:hypothetical protein
LLLGRFVSQLLVERLDADSSASVLAVTNAYAPGLATNFAVFDILLVRPAAGIDRDLNGLIAIRTIDRRLRLGSSIAEREFSLGYLLVIVRRLIVRTHH